MDCLMCKRMFSTKQRLQYHVRHGVCTKKPVSKACENCGKEFSTLQKMQQHVRKEVCIPPSKICGDCNKEFSHVRGLRQHQKKGVCKRRTTQCSFCGKVLSSRQRLQTHKEKHEGSYRFLSRAYDLEGVDCYQCGDILSRCKHKEEYLRNRIYYHRKMNRAFPSFERIEGVPWTNREYWRQECDRCGCVREEGHIPNCLTIV
ncbi:zinc finger protein 418-like [Actinia tenebrosa]|uniref:Zinc finger protein 418-like n=1 Tax=Actinia tenebrosa TaxID=6105 RepID=A0A6P8HM21_ACTTE|nr:zinc finger protein 418-like [Actinia tenebrosa]